VSLSKISAVALACILSATPAFALTPQETAAYRRKCSADYQRLCSAYEPDSPQVQECFRSKIRELSATCREAIGSSLERSGRGR
jgi:transcription initiation factor IIE alpha subunit